MPLDLGEDFGEEERVCKGEEGEEKECKVGEGEERDEKEEREMEDIKAGESRVRRDGLLFILK